MAGESIAVAPDGLEKAHRLLAADKTLQFDLSARAVPKTAEAPGWLKALGRFFEAMSGPLEFLFWVVVGIAVAMLVWFIVRESIGARWAARFRRAKPEEAPAPAWRPSEAQARSLLAEADRLAAEGRYAEAAHHLLLHSIQDVEDHRPRAIRPALTSREIAGMSIMPAQARSAFGRIAAVVESSLFGGRPLGAEEFADCRRSYEAFAFPGAWA